MNAALEKREFGRATSILHTYWLHDLCDTYIVSAHQTIEASADHLQEQCKYLLSTGSEVQQRSARDTLYTALEGALTMIHPFMPFLSEELWQRIGRREGDSTQSVSLAKYPTFDSSLNDTTAESNYELILDVCGAIRSLTASYPISSGAQLYCQLSDDSNMAVIQEHLGSIKSMSGKGIEKIDVLSKQQSKPVGCVAYNVNSTTAVFLYVQGHVDLDSEITKATSKLEKANAGLQKSQKLLNDEGFAGRVNEAVIEAEKTRLADFEAEVRNTQDMIKQFEELKAQ